MVRLVFSDQAEAECDLQPLIDCGGEMVRPLRDPAYFQAFSLEPGALCWRNGLALSGGALHRRLAAQGKLRPIHTEPAGDAHPVP
jgi:hypothetical protein